MPDRVGIVLAEYNRAVDDDTAMGRWAWGFAITFGTSVLFNSAGGNQVIRQWELHRAIQLGEMLTLACVIFVWSITYARPRVVKGRSALRDLAGYPRIHGPWVADAETS